MWVFWGGVVVVSSETRESALYLCVLKYDLFLLFSEVIFVFATHMEKKSQWNSLIIKKKQNNNNKKTNYRNVQRHHMPFI